MTKTKIHIFSSGYCTGNRKHIHRGERAEKIKFHATWALIEHPLLGKLLFDTGYSNRFHEVTSKFPYKLYRWATPVYHNEDQSCINILSKHNITPKDISHIIISHFHADHVGGIKDFPDSPKWFTRSAWQHIQSKNDWWAVKSAYLKPLVPKEMKTNFIDELLPEINWNGFRAWKWTDDILFVDLPGHSRGQTGLYIKNTNLGDVFFIADASWSLNAIRYKIYPSKIVKLFVDDYRQVKDTIDKLHYLSIKNPDLMIIPAHCSEVAAKFSF